MTLKEFYHFSKGFREQKAREENHIRRLNYTLASAYRDPKKPFPNIYDYWPIPEIDPIREEIIGVYQDPKAVKSKLLKAWRLN